MSVFIQQNVLVCEIVKINIKIKCATNSIILTKQKYCNTEYIIELRNNLCNRVMHRSK